MKFDFTGNAAVCKNQLNPQPFNRSFSKARKRIELLFSQRYDPFMIQRNYAQSFDGFTATIMSKITAPTLIHCVGERSENNTTNLEIIIS